MYYFLTQTMKNDFLAKLKSIGYKDPEAILTAMLLLQKPNKQNHPLVSIVLKQQPR
jgi:hypothetical protein